MTEQLTSDDQVALREGLDLLDDLILKCYKAMRDQSKINAKLGDFLKMIELRRKLAPKNQEKQELWNLLRKIRNESLNEHPLVTSQPSEVSGSEEESQ